MIKIKGIGPKGGEVSSTCKGEVDLVLEKIKFNINENGILSMMEEGKKDIIIKIDDLKKIAAGNTLIFDDKTIMDIVEREGLDRPSQEDIEKISKDRDIMDSAHVVVSIMVMEKLAEAVADKKDDSK